MGKCHAALANNDKESQETGGQREAGTREARESGGRVCDSVYERETGTERQREIGTDWGR